MIEDWILEDTFLQDTDTEMTLDNPPEIDEVGMMPHFY